MNKYHLQCTFISAVIFIIDINIPLGVAGGVPYILTVFISLKSRESKFVIFYGALVSSLTVLGFYFSPLGGEFWQIIVNRSIALMAIFLTIVACLKVNKILNENDHQSKNLKKLSKVAERSPNAIIICDKNAKVEYVNEALVEITGYNRDEIIGQNPNILSSGKNPKEVYEDMWATLKGKESWKGELLNKKKTGEEVWIYMTITPILDDNGEIINYVSSEEDLTSLKSAKSSLAENEQKMQKIVEAMPVCVHEINKQGQLISMNPAGLKMMGVDCENKIVGLDYTKIPAKEKQQEITKLMNEAFEGKPSFFDFYVNDPIQNKKIYFESCFVPLNDRDGNIEKLMGISQDITKRKEAEAKLKDALEKAEQGNKIKNEFLSIVSHELITPINGIVGGLELIKEEICEESFWIIEKSSDRLSSTIDDILKFITLSKELTPVNAVEFNLEDLQLSIQKRLLKYSNYELKKTKLSIEWQGWQGLLINDLSMLQSIIWNLLTNSIKFTEKGKIELKAILNENHLQIDITDNGSGIEKAYHEKIFDVFEMVDSSMSRTNQGLGLGLALCKKYVDILKGEISIVSSELDHGTHIRITLPAE